MVASLSLLSFYPQDSSGLQPNTVIQDAIGGGQFQQFHLAAA